MVSILRSDGDLPDFSLGTVPLEEVAVKSRPIPDSFIGESGMDVSRDFIDYLAPLIGTMPEYARLELREVEDMK